MSTPRDYVPPHYRALRVLWTVLQVVFQAVPPDELIGDVGDWAREL
jgi:hypothetical protein